MRNNEESEKGIQPGSPRRISAPGESSKPRGSLQNGNSNSIWMIQESAKEFEILRSDSPFNCMDNKFQPTAIAPSSPHVHQMHRANTNPIATHPTEDIEPHGLDVFKSIFFPNRRHETIHDESCTLHPSATAAPENEEYLKSLTTYLANRSVFRSHIYPKWRVGDDETFDQFIFSPITRQWKPAKVVAFYYRGNINLPFFHVFQDQENKLYAADSDNKVIELNEECKLEELYREFFMWDVSGILVERNEEFYGC